MSLSKAPPDFAAKCKDPKGALLHCSSLQWFPPPHQKKNLWGSLTSSSFSRSSGVGGQPCPRATEPLDAFVCRSTVLEEVTRTRRHSRALSASQVRIQPGAGDQRQVEGSPCGDQRLMGCCGRTQRPFGSGQSGVRKSGSSQVLTSASGPAAQHTSAGRFYELARTPPSPTTPSRK